MKTLEPILLAHPFFENIDQRYLGLLVGCASNARFDPGKLLFRQGEQANHCYLIRHGKVALEVLSPQRGPVVIQTLGDGDLIGWSWLVPPWYWRFDARALELTRAVVLDGTCLRRKCEEDVHLGYELLKRFSLIIAERLEATRMQLLDALSGR